MTKRKPTSGSTGRIAAIIAIVAAAWAWSQPARAEPAPLKVVATIKPVHALAAMVLEGIATPSVIVDGQASPHSFALRPSDARALYNADVVIRVSEVLEPFTAKLVEGLDKSATVVTLAEAPGVELLEVRRGARFEEHDHAHGHDDHGHGKGAKAKAQKTRSSGAQTSIDGHIWLDPENAKAIVRHLAQVMAQRRPDLADKLAANADKSVAALDTLQTELAAATSSIAGRPFIVFHDAYHYFERRFGLEAAGAITLNPEVKPSAKRLSEIRETVRATKAACVFAEPQFSPRIVATVTEGTGARAGTLDPLGSAFPAGAAHYPAMMRALAKAMTDCLG